MRLEGLETEEFEKPAVSMSRQSARRDATSFLGQVGDRETRTAEATSAEDLSKERLAHPRVLRFYLEKNLPEDVMPASVVRDLLRVASRDRDA